MQILPLPQFVSMTMRNQVGNIYVLYAVPVILNICGHRFEIYTLVTEIHENVDFVLQVKNKFELKGIIFSGKCGV